jgi:choline dehydrogenase-like flavoprotein
MAEFDYIVLGAGTSGCVVADRLSEHPANRVLLVEAGGSDRNPLLHIPRIGGRILSNPRYAWGYQTVPFGPNAATETWPRGKTLGGSSSINGMVYNRGTHADYDELERLGNRGWGWADMGPIFRLLECDRRTTLVSRPNEQPDGLARDLIASSTRLGMRHVGDLNETDEPRVGVPSATIHRGRRMSAATAFLRPALSRPNLSLVTHSYAERLLMEDDRVVGVIIRSGATSSVVRARQEVIVCLGALESPRLLQLSGIGPREVLKDAGVLHRVDCEQVGRRMRDHRTLVNTYRVRGRVGHNHLLATSVAKARTGLHYAATRRGPLASPTAEVLAIFRSDPTSSRVDGQMLATPLTVADPNGVTRSPVEGFAGVTCMGEILRPTSEGSVHITSANPVAPLLIDPNYLATEHDRRIGVLVLRTMRAIFEQSPLAERVVFETCPGPDVQSDDEVVEAALTTGATGHHAIGTCAMGPRDGDVVDDELRVRGVDGLRVVDLSVWPIMLSGNTNGPAMAMAWRAAELILDARRPRRRHAARA